MKDPVMALASVATTEATIICQGHLDREDMPALKARSVLVVKRVSPDVMDWTAIWEFKVRPDTFSWFRLVITLSKR